MIVIKIDESKTDVNLPVTTPKSCFKCPFYYTQNVDEGCIDIGWCSLYTCLGYSETNIIINETTDGDGNLIDDVVRPNDKCPLISITKEEA